MPPKNRSKRTKKKGDKEEPGEGDEVNGDTELVSSASQCGSVSSGQSGAEPSADAVEDDDQIDDSSAQEVFEQKLTEAIDGILDKSLNSRVNSMKSLCSALCKRMLVDFLADRNMTITDALERVLKKGKNEEQVLAVKALALLCVQLGLSQDGEDAFVRFRPVMTSLMLDPGAALPARAKCADALGVCGFIASNDHEDIEKLMGELESLFSKSYLKGDGTPPQHSPQVCTLHCSALQAWSLLLTISPPSSVILHSRKHLHLLPGLLESSDVEIRIAGGETIALIYELAREVDENFSGPAIADLCERLRQLSTDNNKHQTKSARKQQRSTFRDVIQSIEDGQVPEAEFKVGQEVVFVDTWARKRQYDSLCANLESGMNTHLQENMLLRDIFNLGAPLPTGSIAQKISKADKRLVNAAAFKARTQVRSKLRDKRMVQLSG